MKRSNTLLTFAIALAITAPQAAHAQFGGGGGGGGSAGSTFAPPMPPGLGGMPGPGQLPGMSYDGPSLDNLDPSLATQLYYRGHNGSNSSNKAQTRTRLPFPGRTYGSPTGGSVTGGGNHGIGGGGGMLPSQFDFGQNANSYAPKGFMPPKPPSPNLPGMGGGGGGGAAGSGSSGPSIPVKFFDNGPF